MAPKQRKYQKSHPWLTFQADLRRANYSLWMMLGAIQSKCEHVAKAIMPPEVAEELLLVHLAKGVQATTAIEGNTLTEEEILKRIRGQRSELPKSKEYLGIEVDNIIKACNQIQNDVIWEDDEKHKLSVETIKTYNRWTLEGLSLPDEITPGEIAKHSVVVATYRGAPREDCPFLLERLCQWMNDEIRPTSEDQEIAFGVIRAILAHLYLAWIHPFGDGNGRTARLTELHLLLSARVPNVVAHLLSNHYNQTRTEYYRQLDYASKSGGDVIRFITYAVQGLFDQLNETISHIQENQLGTAWRDYVYNSFRDETSPVANRQRQVALDLWGKGPQGASISKLREISPKVAEMYAGKTAKTVNRDVNKLYKMKLVERQGHNVIARGELLFAFLPARRSQNKSTTANK